MINNDYLYTSKYNTIDEFILSPHSIYLYSYSSEERSHSVDCVKDKCTDAIFIEIEYDSNKKDIIKEIETGLEYSLRSKSNISNLFSKHSPSTIYIDTTGIINRVLAALLNNAVREYDDVRIIYAEPESYVIKQFQSEGVFNDLAEQIEGIEPLPGFANIIPDDDLNVKLVAFLGFEGGRFTHLIENVQTPYDNIIPVIGTPGYRMEYPFVAYWGNRRALKESDSWSNVRYVTANSMVEVCMLLNKLLNESPKTKIKIAPIGTKPHAIGAMLFAIKHPKEVEIVYDNPKRKIKRTNGVGQIVECNVSKLFKNI